jgi:hypothetical protein
MGIAKRIRIAAVVKYTKTIIELVQRVGHLSFDNIELRRRVEQLESELEAARHTQFKTVIVAPKQGFGSHN